MVSRFRQRLRNELEAPVEGRRFGKGWISGVIALVGAVTALLMSTCILFPALFTVPQMQPVYEKLPYLLILKLLLVLSFMLALVSLVLREIKTLGISAIFCVLVTTLIAQFAPAASAAHSGSIYFGLDWFVLNVLFTGTLFVPLEKLFPKWHGQPLFRQEWREDLFYYFVSSMMVQVLSFLALLPSHVFMAGLHAESFRAAVASQPFVLQFIEIMLLTDLMQYWIHRLFHRVPALWKFHAVHHSARSMDWMAGARMHFVEILLLRGFTVIPMMVLGYSTAVVQAYILVVYIYSTFIHANIGWPLARTEKLLVTPRFHHWHHGIEHEAVDVNFAIHFPFLDKIFGTLYLPPEKWPEGYGVENHPVPVGYLAQFLYPFRR